MTLLSFETVGKVVGGLLGGVSGGLSNAATSPETYAGAATGATMGAAAGLTTVGTLEPVFVPTGAALGGLIGGSKAFVDGFGPGVHVGSEALGNAGRWLDNQIAQMMNADDTADKAEAKASPIACATCSQNPCAALACGTKGAKYRGGAHGCMTGTPETVGDGLDSHHMPADSVSTLNRQVGPAIQMDPADHRKTNSYGGSVNGPRYAAQRGMVARGQTMAALMMDVADVKAIAAGTGNPTKYDGAIAQMLSYAQCLKQNRIIQ